MKAQGLPSFSSFATISVAIAGFVAKAMSSGTDALARRAGSSAHAFGKYSRRSISACPQRLAR